MCIVQNSENECIKNENHHMDTTVNTWIFWNLFLFLLLCTIYDKIRITLCVTSKWNNKAQSGDKYLSTA